VIDTGIDMTHPDLAANIDSRNARNFVEPGQEPDDDFGHGTHVAGIVAAVGDNLQGACGVAYRARILPIRVLGVDGTGTTWNTVTAIEYAVERQASVINLSLGSPDYSSLEAEAVARARAAGALVVAAAGNEAGDGNYLEYPASYEGVVSVGAVGPDLKRALFSNYNSWVTLAAPGVDIFSTIPARFSPAVPYGYLSGTSMAAPMVAGAAALLFSQNPRWTPAQVQERLRRTVRDLAPPSDLVPGFDVFHGAGLLDAGRALGR
jgi:subtilisin family serine protease